MSFRRVGFFAVILVVASLLIWFRPAPSKPSSRSLPLDVRAVATQTKAAQGKALENFMHAPLPFEANLGQTDPEAKFVARGVGYTVFLTPKSVLLRLSDPKIKDRDNVIEMQVVGARNAGLQGLQPLASRSHYFHGNSPKTWQANVPHYGKVSYTGVRPDTDLVFYGRQGELEYDVVLGPHANPKDVVLQFTGATHLKLNPDGDLVLALGNGREILQRRPKIYQQSGGRKTEVAGGYRLLAANRVRFDVGAYDAGKPLVIDPVLTYATYLGGSSIGNDSAASVAIDAAGNAYIAGYTGSVGFPTGSTPPIQPRRAGGNDAFIAKMSADGTTLLYSSYLGGTSDDSATAIAVDSSGRAYVVGSTSSADFPTTPGAFAHNQPAPGQNVFVAKLNAAGSALVYATYLGPGQGTSIAANANGNAYVTGNAYCCSFPTTPGAFQRTATSDSAFVTKLTAAGSALVWSTLLGGNSSDYGSSLAIDSSQNVYVTGYTYSPDFPVTAGAIQPALSGYVDAFVTKMNSSGSAPVYSTFLGGTNYDTASGIAVDTQGFAYVTGSTQSWDFPTTPGAYQTTLGGYQDAFAVKLNQTGTGFVYSTHLGSYTNGYAVGVDSAGNAYLVGQGSLSLSPGAYYNSSECCGYLAKLDPGGSTLLYSAQPGYTQAGLALDTSGNVYLGSYSCTPSHPVTPGAYQQSLAGGCDATIAKFNSSATALVYSTFLGGSGGDQGLAITMDSSGNAYVTGSAGSLDFPVTTTPARPTAGPYTQVFVTKFDATGTSLAYSAFVSGSSNDTGRAISVDGTGSVYVAGQTNSIDFPVTGGAPQTAPGGGYDAFLFKLDPIGQLVYSTLIGGSADEDGRALAVDAAGNAYVAGNTGSFNFPRTSVIGPSSPYYGNVFVAKVNPSGSAFLYSTLLGGSYLQFAYGLAVDASGSAYVTGNTSSSDFPVTPGAFQTAFPGSTPAFVTKLNPAGSALSYSTYLGGPAPGYGTTNGSAVAVDGTGNAYVTGSTTTPTFPVTAGAFQPSLAGYQNAFVTKLNAGGSALLYSTFLGGSGSDQGTAIAVDGSGNAVVAGNTQSGNFPIVDGTAVLEVALPNYYSYSSAFVSSVSSTGTSLQYSTYLASNTGANGVGVQPGKAVIAGTTLGTEVIGAVPGYQKVISPGAQNAFVAQISDPPPGCTYSVSPTSFNVGGNGGVRTVNVTAGAGCPWTAFAASSSRVQLNAPPGGVVGSGNGSVSFTVPADTYPSDSGTVSFVTVAGRVITITQTAPCPVTLPSNGITIGSSAFTSGSFTVNSSSCYLSAFTRTPWITTPGYYFYGSSNISYSVLPNLTNATRTGVIYIGPLTFTVKQLAGNTTTATMVSPLPGSTLTGSSVTFAWTPIAGADQYRLGVGTSSGQGNLCSTQTANAQFTCVGLPSDGRTLYVQLRTHVGGVWGQVVQYTYTAANATLAQLLSPAPVTPYPGPPTTVLPGTRATFTWSAGIGADQYRLDVGSSPNQSDLCTVTTGDSLATCSSLPCDSRVVYAQVSTHWASGWQLPFQYVYLACSPTLANITSPTPLSTLSGSKVTFKWTSGVGADQYRLDVGTAPGQANVCSTTTAVTQSTCSGIPTNGAPVYVQLATHTNGAWQPPQQYTYTAAAN